MLFGLFVLLGAVLAGKNVAVTLGKGLLPAERMGFAMTTIVMLSVGLSLLAANLLRVPQSTSQATVFALVGPAALFGVLKTDRLLFEMLPTWFILPVIAFVLAYGIGRWKRARGGTRESSKASGRVTRIFVLFTACYVAFAIGSNNVANAAGPVATMVLNELQLRGSAEAFLPVLLIVTLAMVPCFAIGSALFGGPLIRRTGREIISLDAFEAVAISTITASLLLWASLSRGIPTSLVQLNAAAIIGMAMAREGVRSVAARASVRGLFLVWAVAPALAFVLALGFTGLARLGGYV